MPVLSLSAAVVAALAGCQAPVDGRDPVPVGADVVDADTDAPDTDPDDTDVTDTVPTDPGPCIAGVAAFIGPSIYPQFADALAASVDGDTIVLCPGTWAGVEDHHYEGKLTIRGSTGNPADVVLLPVGADGVALRLQTSHLGPTPEVTIADLTVRGDMGIYGGFPAWDATRGFFLADNVRLEGPGVASMYVGFFRQATLRRLDVVGVAASLMTLVAIGELGSSLSIEDSTFVGNQVAGGALLSVRRSANLPDHLTVDIRHSLFKDNALGAGKPVGLALPGYDSTVRLSNVTFLNNDGGSTPSTVGESTGAIRISSHYTQDDSNVNIYIEDSVFDGNIGDYASAIDYFRGVGPGRVDVWVSDSSFYRGSWTALFESSPEFPGREGGAGMTFTVPRDVTYHFDNVDLGSGPTANRGTNLWRCPTLEGIITGTYDPFTCPE